MGKKLFWSRDMLDNHEFDCLAGARVRVRVVDSFGVMARVRVGIRVKGLCKTVLFC